MIKRFGLDGKQAKLNEIVPNHKLQWGFNVDEVRTKLKPTINIA